MLDAPTPLTGGAPVANVIACRAALTTTGVEFGGTVTTRGGNDPGRVSFVVPTTSVPVPIMSQFPHRVWVSIDQGEQIPGLQLWPQ